MNQHLRRELKRSSASGVLGGTLGLVLAWPVGLGLWGFVISILVATALVPPRPEP